MAASYNISLDADSSDLDRSVDRAMDKLDKLADKAGDVSIGGAGRRSGGGGGIGGLSTDPWSKLTEAQSAYHEAKAAGLSGDALRPFQYRETQATAAVNRADRLLQSGGQGGGGLSLWARLGANGLSIRGTMGMLGAGGMAAAAVGYAGYEFGTQGLASADDLRSAYWSGGGTSAETAQASGIGRMMGMSASETAGSAISLGKSLHGGTYGAGWLRAQGIVDLGGLTTDKDTNFIKAVTAITNVESDTTARRVALDVPELGPALWMRDLPPDERKEAISGLSDDETPSARRATARQKAQAAKVSSWWEHVKRNFVSQTWGQFGTELVMDALTGGGYSWSRRLGGEEWYDNPIDALTPNFREKEAAKVKAEEDKKNDRFNPSIDKSPRTQPGMVGGGRRAQDSLPQYVKGQQLDQNIDAYGRYSGGYYGGG